MNLNIGPLAFQWMHLLALLCTLLAICVRRLAAWAPAADEARTSGIKQVWEVSEQWLKASGGKASQRKLNTPKLGAVPPNRGYVA